MADIRPFMGYRPEPHIVEQVASPPYDVMNAQEAREMAAGNPHSFLHVVRAEIDFPPDVDSHSDIVYQKSADNLQNMIKTGVMLRDPSPCYYVYELTMGEHVQRGLMAGTSVAEYKQGLIKKHEFTRRDKEDDRAHHVEILGANTGPVMMTYRANTEIDTLLDEQCSSTAPVYDFVAEDGIRHVMWVMSDPATVDRIQTLFTDVPTLYIADGHHRSAAGFRVGEKRRDANPDHDGTEPYNYYLSVLFPDDQLQILGYYRAVEELGGLSKKAFLQKVGEVFEVKSTDAPMPGRLHEFKMFLDGSWYTLTAKEGTYPADDPVRSLDCSILQENLLSPILGIGDPRVATGIDFIGGIRGTGELERRCNTDMKVAFALFPVTVGQLMAIADSGAVMPPKSTWFEPKLRSGMVVRSLEG